MSSKATMVTVVGGVNIDISAALASAFVHGDSIPGHVAMGYGGVARNMAHNLLLLGHTVRLVTLFGGDAFGTMCRQECLRLGMDLSLAESREDLRNGLYMCVNDQSGDMIVAVADTDIIEQLSPEFLAARIDALNASAAVVADANLSTAALAYLMDHCRVPLMVDAVSTAKAARVVAALDEKPTRHLHMLKLNRIEALSATATSSVEQAAQSLLARGVGQVCVTLGAGGVLCCDERHMVYYPSQPVDVVNTTGAGDAFLAAVAHAQLAGVSFPQLAIYAQRVARATLAVEQSVNPEIMNISFT
ncbi:MAG: hypothetical protein IJ632_01340 [Muribaculaceae bacterium]|nr:hypothetical protein [Muribaculaceae bacterium]